jgi:hypothetical protein
MANTRWSVRTDTWITCAMTPETQLGIVEQPVLNGLRRCFH